MTLVTQIYAATSVADALTLAELGVDHVGFVAGDYGLVHGELSLAQARAIVEALPAGVVPCALTMATDVDEILRMAREVRPAIVHVSTDPWDVDVEAMATLRRRLPRQVRLMKAIPVADDSALELARQFAPVSDLLLLDTKVAGLPGVGATGATHDWQISRRIVAEVGRPVILAGGLTPDNVARAIAAVQPWGVDSNTGTNLPGDPVTKDFEKVRAFVRRAKQATVGAQ